MRAGRDQAGVAVVVAAAEVVARGSRAGPAYSPWLPGVRLQAHRVVAGDRGQPVLEVGDQLAHARCVGRRARTGAVAANAGPGDRLHLGGGVELHRARAERDHAAVQRDVLVGQRPQVAQHRGLGAVAGERRVGEEVRGARLRIGDRSVPRFRRHGVVAAERVQHRRDMRRRWSPRRRRCATWSASTSRRLMPRASPARRRSAARRARGRAPCRRSARGRPTPRRASAAASECAACPCTRRAIALSPSAPW